MLGLLIDAQRRSGGRVPTSTELAGAAAILDRGAAPLSTPSSRALAAGFAAAIGAALGRHVHVLAQDDDRAGAMAAAARGMLEQAGIGSGVLQAAQPASVRRQHLAQPIVFAAVHQVARDYLAAAAGMNGASSATLRSLDALARTPLDLGAAPPICTDFAIVDAMDVLLCEGGTARLLAPAATEDPGSDIIEQALGLADGLQHGFDFSGAVGSIELTDAGEVRIAFIGNMIGHPWRSLPFDRRLRLVRRALEARRLGDRDFRVQDGKLVALTEAARSAFAADPDDHPSTLDFATVRAGLAHRSRGAPTRISVCRFVRKYHRLGGTVTPSVTAARELANRFAIVSGHLPPRLALRLRAVGNQAAADALLVSKVRSTVACGRSILVVAAEASLVAGVAGKLTAAAIECTQLQGSPAEADAGLVAGALRRPRSVVVIGPGREIDTLREVRTARDARPQLVLFGMESGGAMPNAVIGALPLREFEPGAEAIVNAAGGCLGQHLTRTERRILGRSRLLQSVGWFLVRAAFIRAARQRGRIRTDAYHFEEQQIASLAFAGAATGRL